MLDHHLQRSIVYQLTFADSLRFSELKPDEIENKLFTYHLKKVVAAGLVVKDNEGAYSLTTAGKSLGVRVLEDQKLQAAKPHSISFLVIRRKVDGAWLLYKRSVHPLKGLVGFMHASPIRDSDVCSAARNEVKQKTGLLGDFTVKGAGFFRMFEGDQLQSYTHYTLLACEDIEGELHADHTHAGYFWLVNPNFEAKDMLPNMSDLVAAYNNKKQFFLEKSYTLDN